MAGKDKSRPRHRLLHRAILDAPSGVLVDHVDGDGLNNVRSNLRLATVHENGWNRRLDRDNNTGLKGIVRQRDAWRASIRVKGKLHSLGCHATAQEAARAYDAAAFRFYGPFARPNFPNGEV